MDWGRKRKETVWNYRWLGAISYRILKSDWYWGWRRTFETFFLEAWMQVHKKESKLRLASQFLEWGGESKEKNEANERWVELSFVELLFLLSVSWGEDVRQLVAFFFYRQLGEREWTMNVSSPESPCCSAEWHCLWDSLKLSRRRSETLNWLFLVWCWWSNIGTRSGW